MTANQQLTDWNRKLFTLLRSLKESATKQFCRHLIVLAGERAWCKTTAQDISEELDYSTGLWVSDDKRESATSLMNGRQLLGHETEFVVFDAHYGFDPDTFGVVTNTVLGGGLFLLLSPELNLWPSFEDPQKKRIAIWPYQASDVSGRFLQRFVNALRQDKHSLIIEQNNTLPEWNSSPIIAKSTAESGYLENQVCATRQQQQAVEAIIHVVKGHRRRPLVITSDRGRGKSSALGIASSQLLQQNDMHILVTAPSLSSVSSLFSRVTQLCKGVHINNGSITVRGAKLRYFPPDELLRKPLPCHLLLVDEAAGIPTPILEELLKSHSRIVFATTVHGYEGTGRGFAVRFKSVLDSVTPGWKSLSLTTPIRWALNDPLEKFTFRGLLLDAEAAPEKAISTVTPASSVVEKIDRDKLADDEETLAEIFGLLILAHYQTQPADLRYLLDGLDLEIYVLRQNKHVVAAALLEQEGNLQPDLVQGVYENRRRVRGHLIPQTLTSYVGLEQAAYLRYLRVVRIAVHPEAQRKGLGAHLLNTIFRAESRHFDIIGASFGVTAGLLKFWHNSDFKSVSIGLSRNSSSGMHSALVVKPVSAQGEEMVSQARRRFVNQFPYRLSESFQDLNPDLVMELMSEFTDVSLAGLNEHDWRDLQSFAYSLRSYEANSVALWRLCRVVISDRAFQRIISVDEQAALIGKVLQKKPWNELAEQVHLSGRDEVTKRLRCATGKLYSYYFKFQNP